LLAVNVNAALQRDTAEELYQTLIGAGLEVFLDDRDERPGVKFKDADLIGAPIRITVGTGFIKSGTIELRARRDGSDRKIAKEALVPAIKELAQSLQ
jgi:prolyl-tRNA synthetase